MRPLLTLAALAAFGSAFAQNAYDSRIDSYKGLAYACDGTVTPVLRIQNVGTNTMATCVVETWKNGVIDNSFNWILAVPAPQNDFRQPALPNVNVGPGDQLEFRIISVNGQLDQGPTENIFTKSIGAASEEAGSYLVKVDVMTDGNPQETTWELRNDLGQLVAQGGPYANANELATQWVTLSASECYGVKVVDSGNDGMTQRAGDGYVKVYSQGNAVIDIDGGAFTSSADAGLHTGTDDCAPTTLIPASCGATGLFLNGSSTISAEVIPGATKYQFEFTRGTYLRRIATVNPTLTLVKWATNPLKPNRTYTVRVRASFNGGATWCPYGASCSISIVNPPGTTRETVACMAAPVVLEVFPNPNDGSSFQLVADDLDMESGTAILRVFDMVGRVVIDRQMLVVDHTLSMAVDPQGALLPGMYMLVLEAGDALRTTRLVVR